ncbi:9989_t:CDS:2 [Dentiscutata erythropus]|uniref:9989_t:CDS:1 n=1 Tax=Dentiscutata erythropus TaxID=1348616 RepID=A0A9N9CXR5_9GLOM|nr:9989_t:CDS:2 [Dentiscutata erythropus]
MNVIRYILLLVTFIILAVNSFPIQDSSENATMIPMMPMMPMTPMTMMPKPTCTSNCQYPYHT